MKSTNRLKIFVDTNVLLDFLLPGREAHVAALDLFQLILQYRIEAAVSTQSILNVAYIIERHHDLDPAEYRAKMQYMMDRISVDGIDWFHMKDALKDPAADLEDNAQIAYAYSQCCDFFLTHDKKLLSRTVPSPMKVIPPEEFINHCRA